MRISIPTSGYNHRRDSKPWICRITSWPVGALHQVAWGQWYGRPGSGGELVIVAEPGQIVRYGQNDLRKARGGHTYRQYCAVTADGSLIDLSPADAARLAQGVVTLADLESAFRVAKRAEAEKTLAHLELVLSRGIYPGYSPDLDLATYPQAALTDERRAEILAEIEALRSQLAQEVA